MHSATANLRAAWSEKMGIGLEHHLPQPYSHVGVGVTVEMHLVDDVVVLVVGIMLVKELVVVVV